MYDFKILLFGGGNVEGEIFGDMQSLDLSQMVSNQQKILHDYYTNLSTTGGRTLNLSAIPPKHSPSK
jgi:hypothetical protein